MEKLHDIAGLSEVGGPEGLNYKLKIGYHSRFLVGNRESNTQRGLIDSLYIALGFDNKRANLA